MTSRSYQIIGACFDFASDTRGCSDAPQTLRDAGLFHRMNYLEHFGIHATDGGDIYLPERKSNDNNRSFPIDDLVTFGKILGEKLNAVYQEDLTPIVIGGDHTISMASVAAAKRFLIQKYGAQAQLGLIWVDAHPDLETPASSGSGNLHGMVAAHLLGNGVGKLCQLLTPAPVVRPEHLVFIGIQDASPAEREMINNQGVNTYTINDIIRDGIATVWEKVVSHLQARTDGIAVSFDLDVCDPREAPGVQTPEQGGLLFREARLIMEYASMIEQLVLVDLVELNPRLDPSTTSLQTTIALLEAVVGHTII